jgi:hypothetical protein
MPGTAAAAADNHAIPECGAACTHITRASTEAGIANGRTSKKCISIESTGATAIVSILATNVDIERLPRGDCKGTCDPAAQTACPARELIFSLGTTSVQRYCGDSDRNGKRLKASCVIECLTSGSSADANSLSVISCC